VVLKVGDRFIHAETGELYEITAISEHQHFVNMKYRGPNHYDWIVIADPKPYNFIEWCIRDRRYIPDTPAGRVLYEAGKRKI